MKWILDQKSIDWDELSNLYRIAPLGDKKQDDLKISFLNSKYKCFVFDGGRLVGAGRALADGIDCSYLCDIAVHPDAQGHGLGRAIISKLKELSVGHRKIILYANPGTEDFYKQLGFRRMRTAMAIFENQERAARTGLIDASSDAQMSLEPQGARMINIREIDHLVLRTANLDAMLQFYCDVLGCSVERRQDEIGLVQLRAGRSLVDLVPVSGKLGAAGGAAPGKEGRNLDHLCFRVDPFDESDIRQHLQAHGIDAGTTSSRYGAEGEGPSIYVTDPEGNVVELKGPAGE